MKILYRYSAEGVSGEHAMADPDELSLFGEMVTHDLQAAYPDAEIEVRQDDMDSVQVIANGYEPDMEADVQMIAEQTWVAWLDIV